MTEPRDEPHDELGRILATLLKKETDAMQIDTSTASQRLDGELTRTRKRRRATWAAAAGVAAAAALGFVVWNQTGDPSSTAPADVVSDTETTVTSATPYFLDLSTGERTPLPDELVPEASPGLGITYSQDGTAAALDCKIVGTCGDHSKLEVVSSEGDVTEIPVPSEFTAEAFAWSRDGTKLLYRLTNNLYDLGDLFVYDLDQAVSTQVTDLGLERVYWVDMRAEFSPDGETVVYHRPRDGDPASKLDVWTVPATGGDSTLRFRDAAQPEFLPDGRRIAFVQPGLSSLTGLVIAVAAPGDRPEPLFEMPDEIIDFQLSPDATRALTSGENGSRLVDVGTGEISQLDASAQWAGNDVLLMTPDH